MRLLLCVIGLFLGFAAATPGAAANPCRHGNGKLPGAHRAAAGRGVRGGARGRDRRRRAGARARADDDRRPGQSAFRVRDRFRPGGDRTEDRTYAVRAQVSVGRKLIFVSDTMNPVLTNGAPNEVHVWMIKVGDTSAEARAAPAGDRGARAAAAGELQRRAALRRLRGGAVPAEPLARPGVPPAPRPGRTRTCAATRSGGGRSTRSSTC